MASERQFSLSEASALFKIKYEKLSENVYNSANVLLGRVKKSYNFTGKQLQITVPQSFGGQPLLMATGPVSQWIIDTQVLGLQYSTR